ncbi:MAG: hypothetical protein PHQ66_03060 [Candidatus Nanoarchaeia archaeon]|nr:hypothetical protein [Candidatus Nanoarchaeia archaeon]MDD5357654.1 hypothetical protein [Candidatus Nanoarchaeia archaeon]MDD5588573.1 hypothetical protein [Candidatus Nanoarchaeia archaeon]
MEYIIEATVGKGKINYKYSVKYDLEIPGVIDGNRILLENDEFTKRINLKSAEKIIAEILKKSIDRDVEKICTFHIKKDTNLIIK